MPDASFFPPPRTIIPTRLREKLGAWLQGPPPGPRRRRRRACLFARGHYGDFILTLSALRLLVQEFGPAQCTVVVSPAVVPLATAELPGVDLIVLPVSAGSLTREILPIWWRYRRQFSVDRFDCLVCLNHRRTFFRDIVLTWADAEKDFRTAPSAYPPAEPETSAELLAHWRLAEKVLGRPLSRDEILPRLTSATSTNDGRLLVYPLSHDGSKDLPSDRVVALLRRWRERSRAPLVFGGSPAEAGKLQGYAAAARAAGLDGVTVETPAGIRAFLQHVAGTGALVSADSAAAHIGTALDKPTVVLMGPQLYGYCQPWRKSDRQVAFLFDESDDKIAAALGALARSDK